MLSISLAACATTHPGFTGAYEPDLANSVMPPGVSPPPGFRYEIEDTGDEFHLVQTSTRPDGSTSRTEWRGPPNGEPRPATADVPHTLSITREGADTFAMRGYNRDGQPLAHVETCRLYADGRGFACTGVLNGDAPFTYTYGFRRVR
jgi:hypothetical protein